MPDVTPVGISGDDRFWPEDPDQADNILAKDSEQSGAVYTDKKGEVQWHRGHDYYQAARIYFTQLNEKKVDSLNHIKGVLFLLSAYITASVFFAYAFSLFSSMHTVSYLALTEDQEEV